MNFRITIRGRSVHGCVRDEGVSALDKLWPVYRELLALEAERNHNASWPLCRGYPTPFPLSVGVVRGGDWPSTVPDWLRLEGRYGLMPGEAVEDLEKTMRVLAVMILRFCGCIDD